MDQLFRSSEEQAEPVQAVVKGDFPSWLQGSFVRLGPGKFELGKTGDFMMNHWFDGYAILYKFDIKNGKVTFSKRFLQSDAYKRAVCVGRPVFTEYGTRSYPDPCKNIFSRMMSSLIPDVTDNNVIGLYTMEDSMYVASETSILIRVDPKDLKTHEKTDLGKFVGLNIASSHVVKDEKGTSYCLGSSILSGIKHHIVKIPQSPSGKANDAWKKAKVLANIPSPYKVNYNYYHSFGMSPNYFVLIEQPMLVNAMKLISLPLKGKALKECMEWHPEEESRFVVIEKGSGKIVPVKYKSSAPFFLFHHINTYEEDGHLIVDIIAYDSPELLDKLYLEQLRSNEFHYSDLGGGRRFILPLPKDGETINEMKANTNLVTLKGTKATALKVGDAVTLTCEIISEPGYDLPTMNNSYYGKKYKYFYAVGLFNVGGYQNSIVKVNTLTGEVTTWKEGPYTFAGEVQFIPRTSGSTQVEEDDGILLSCITDIRREEPDYLLILNAKDLTEIARAEVSVQVPIAIHGIFI
ncbi:beta,beta-carotene 15,15'-dioxygenase-like [Ischnura elegans]|uniref:beta,beta-carotene 15,15'-dioxygenase-like n=1 Tax=Ischnura elegans TaxID=197161 RepID=UPI001ED86641|nr:beta,beta-carotene 15,15'-dioxygenase-like [Ischnura elegans]